MAAGGEARGGSGASRRLIHVDSIGRDESMRSTRVIIMTILSLAFCISCQMGVTVEDRSAANATANEIIYGTENDELTASTGVMNKSVISPNPTTVSGTAVFDGLISGTRTVAFSNYSNVAGRTIDSGTVTVSISSGSFSSSTPNTNPNPAIGSTVTHTVSNVNKTITGTVSVDKGGRTYTCVLDLTVVVISRVTDWTLDFTYDLIHPSVQSRNVTVTGTVEVNGKPVTIEKTITTAAPEE
jgi:hypothetical protein